MILSLIGIHSIKAPLICPCTHRDGYSFLLYLIISYVHHLLSTLQCYWSVPFHLVSLIPSTSIPYSFISLATCPAHVVSAMVLTFQQPTIVCRMGATMVPIGLWASGRLKPKSIIAAPAATPPVSVVSLSTLLVSVTVSVFMELGR